MKWKLQRVHYMPRELEPGVLYVSDEFETAAHLCACGCGSKIRTPLGLTEWKLRETESGPSLYPSIGNWQLPCQSHYWIMKGETKWDIRWTPEEIIDGRQREMATREAYYKSLYERRRSKLRLFWNWVKNFFGLSEN